MSLHFQCLGQVGSQKTVDLLKKQSDAEHEEEIEAFGNELEQLLKDDEYFNLADKTLAALERFPQDKTQLQPIYAAIQFWITQIENAKQQNEMIDKFLVSISKIQDEQAAFKTKLLASLFNSFTPSKLSLSLFYKLLDQSKRLNTQNLIMPSIIQNLDGFLEQWNFNYNSEIVLRLLNFVNDTTSILKLSEYALRNTQLSQEQYQATFVSFFNANTSFLKLSEIAYGITFKVLQNTPIFALIHSILNGEIDGSEQLFQKENQFFEKCGLQLQQCLAQARIGKFINLPNKSYTYDQIAQELKIKEVEVWVITAIQQENIVAQIDQSSQMIYLIDNSKRFLTKKDWQQLHTKLTGLLKQLTI